MAALILAQAAPAFSIRVEDPIHGCGLGALLPPALAAALDAEARLYLIEGRVRVSGLAAAEKDVGSFLGRHADSERRPEALFLRAEILRKVHGRCADAVRDYAAAASSPRVADDALFFQAHCLGQIGDEEGARRGFARYLTRFPQGRHAAAARAAAAAPARGR